MMGEDDDSLPAKLEQSQDLIIETMGRLAEFWGFTRTMGRVFGALFISPNAMSQHDLVERLGVSTANVSMSINGLLRWGAVKKVYERGKRKHFYTAETEIRKIIKNVVGTREKSELMEAFSNFTDAMDVLKGGARIRRELSKEEEFVLERIAHLESVVKISNKLLDMLLNFGQIDVAAEVGTDS
jgi:DNA-binding transcriptional regulator GbsR (MarR family)